MGAEQESPRDVIVIGGGPAGLTTALYATRLGHDTRVYEKAGGRHEAVAHVHNLYGVSEDVSGAALSSHAVDQLREYGGDHRESTVTDVRQVDYDRDPGENSGGDRDHRDAAEARFVVETNEETARARSVVFATGFTDRDPDVPGLVEFTGRGLHYCLHCDLYGLGDAPAYILGHDDHAARVAMVLLNVTADVDLLLDGHEPTWDAEHGGQIDAHPVSVVEEPVVGAYPTGNDAEPWLGGLRFADGTDRDYRGGFAMYGREYETPLAEGLGCRLADDGALAVDDSHETSVEGAYGVGDVTHGQNQTTIAMADGARAAIAIHKALRRYPRPPGEAVDAGAPPAAPAALRDRMAATRLRDRHAGLSESQLEE